MASESKVWLITGCGSGFGRSMAQYALAQGDKVVATVRTGSATALDGLRAAHPGALLVVHLDVAHAKEIPRAFEQAQAAFGRVDVVFNNAGVSLVGEVEGTPEDAARKTFDVNFWGAVNVSREAVRFFREENERGVGGRLLVNSSFAGICPIACGGFYSSTKFALEGITQTLAQELDPEWNIKVTLVEAGFFRTPGNAKGPTLPQHPAYTNPDSPSTQARVAIAKAVDNNGTTRVGDVQKAVQKIYDVAKLPDPPMRLVLGKDAVETIRGQLGKVLEDVAKYEAWSEDLLEDENKL